jgi:membrane-bound lytic murein transglycosylase D
LGRCAPVILLALLAASLPGAAGAAASPSALPDFLWVVPADSKRAAAAAAAAAIEAPAPRDASLQRREMRDPLSLPRTIDLTKSPDDLWERIRRGFSMPNLDSPLVRNRQVYYVGQKAYFERMVARSRRYMYHIVEEIEKRGMPTEIALLPMVESAFNPMAYSRAHASGLWQFIPSTGKNYKLKQNWWFDERRDIMASTTAALDYLQYLYEMYGDWHLALASYNWGENAVARAIAKNKKKGLPTDYLHLSMPRETKYYVPKLQALKNIVMNPAAFGLNLDPIPNEPYFVTISTDKDIDIRVAAKLAEMPIEELIALNPAYKRPVLAGSQRQTLVLPADRAELFEANLESHSDPLVSWQTYTLKPGDKLDKLAARHGITLARLKLVNGITRRTRVTPGMQLMLPIKGSDVGADPIPAAFFQPTPDQPRRGGKKLVHVVKSGDTLFAIARRYRVSVESLKRWNSRIGEALVAGQRVIIFRGSAPSTRKISSKAKQVSKPKPIAGTRGASPA